MHRLKITFEFESTDNHYENFSMFDISVDGIQFEGMSAFYKNVYGFVCADVHFLGERKELVELLNHPIVLENTP